MPPTVACVELPALSLTEAAAARSLPSPSTVLSAGHAPSRPESASLHVQATTTSPLYQPFAFGLVVGAPVSDGRRLVDVDAADARARLVVRGVLRRAGRALVRALAERHRRGAERDARERVVALEADGHVAVVPAVRVRGRAAGRPRSTAWSCRSRRSPTMLALLPALSTAVPFDRLARALVRDDLVRRAARRSRRGRRCTRSGRSRRCCSSRSCSRAGSARALIDGAVLSTLTSMLFFASAFPALSTLQYSSV